MKTIEELRKLSSEELNAELLDLRREQFNLRLKKANNSLEKTDRIGKVRKTIARVKTLITEKVGSSHVR